eukprot:7276304-Pyramimonas_sp.AAC.1
MGGTASPLLWCIGYDPIITAISDVTGDSCPTFVDDLASLLQDATQTLRATIAFTWASRAAGLLVNCHTCCGVEAQGNTS